MQTTPYFVIAFVLLSLLAGVSRTVFAMTAVHPRFSVRNGAAIAAGS